MLQRKKFIPCLMSGVTFHCDILIIHAQFFDIILISFIEIIDLKIFLRPCSSCARGGCPSCPTLATALLVSNQKMELCLCMPVLLNLTN